MKTFSGGTPVITGAGPGDVDVIADVQPTPPSVIFHPASEINETAVAQAQADLRRRILRAFVGRGLIDSVDAKEMLMCAARHTTADSSNCISQRCLGTQNPCHT